MTYREYLQTTEWKQLRQRTLERDGGICRLCRKPATCVHHSNYNEKTLAGDHIIPLFSLCDNCHVFVEFDDLGNKTTLQEMRRRMRERAARNNVPVSMLWDYNHRFNCGDVCGKPHESNIPARSLGLKVKRKNMLLAEMAPAERILSGIGCTLRKCTEWHYQFIHKSGWLINVYPTTGTIHPDTSRRVLPPRISIPRKWTLLQLAALLRDSMRGATVT